MRNIALRRPLLGRKVIVSALPANEWSGTNLLVQCGKIFIGLAAVYQYHVTLLAIWHQLRQARGVEIHHRELNQLGNAGRKYHIGGAILAADAIDGIPELFRISGHPAYPPPWPACPRAAREVPRPSSPHRHRLAR